MDIYNCKLFLHTIFQIPSNYQIPAQITNEAVDVLFDIVIKINKIQTTKPILTFKKGIDDIDITNLPILIQIEMNKKMYNRCIYHHILLSGRIIYLHIISEIQDKTNYLSLYNNICLWLHFIDSITKNTNCCRILTIYIILNHNDNYV